MPTTRHTHTLLALTLALALAACSTSTTPPNPAPDPTPNPTPTPPPSASATQLVQPGEYVMVLDPSVSADAVVLLAGERVPSAEIESVAGGVRFRMPDPPRNGRISVIDASGVEHEVGEAHAFGLAHVEAPRTSQYPHDQPLRDPFVLLVLNTDLAPIPGVAVEFSATGAYFSESTPDTSASARTDALGMARVRPSIPEPDWPPDGVDRDVSTRAVITATIDGQHEAHSVTYTGTSREYLLGFPLTLASDDGEELPGWLRLREEHGELVAAFHTVNHRLEDPALHYLTPSASALERSRSAAPPATSVVPNATSVIVQVRDVSSIPALALEYDLEIVRFVSDDTFVASPARDESVSMRDLALALARDERVLIAEPNAYLQSLAHYHDDPEQILWLEHHHFALGMPLVWSEFTGEGVTIAVIDGGFWLDRVHDLDQDLILPGANFCPVFGAHACEGVTSDPGAQDLTNNHGTLSVGMIAAQRNAIGTTGIAPRARIVPVNVAPDATIGFIPSDRLAMALRWVAGEHVPGAPRSPERVDIVNLSLAGRSESLFVRDAIETLERRGIVVIASAGNDGTNERQYPAAFPTVIGVAAASEHALTQRASWSSYGPWVSLMAPSENLLTACYSSLGMGIVERQICGYTGTSAAAPIVSGAVALLLEANPGLTPANVRAHLAASAYRDASMPSNQIGAGVLRIDALLGRVAPRNASDREITLTLTNAGASVTLTSDLLTGVGHESSASALPFSGEATLSFERDDRVFSASFPIALSRVRQPPTR